MIRDRIRDWVGGLIGADVDTARAQAPETRGTTAVLSPRAAQEGEPSDRMSRGLLQMVQSLPARPGLSILDLGEVSQANVAYITGLGHRHVSEDVLSALDAVFGSSAPEAQDDPAKMREFLDTTLRITDRQFDAVLVWDTLQFLSPPLLEATMERLLRSVRPGGVMLALFHAEVRQASVPVHSYRILDDQTLRLSPKGHRAPAQTFTNRSLERLFESCHSVKFFLTRDSLKEVIVRR